MNTNRFSVNTPGFSRDEIVFIASGYIYISFPTSKKLDLNEDQECSYFMLRQLA